MERALQKIARQINSYDEASYMALWEKYAELVRRFEPTKRWEEAAVIFGIIQGVRMKNQLFNHHWAQTGKPAKDVPHPYLGVDQTDPRDQEEGDHAPKSAGETGPEESRTEENESRPPKGKLLKLPKRDKD